MATLRRFLCWLRGGHEPIEAKVLLSEPSGASVFWTRATTAAEFDSYACDRCGRWLGYL